MHFGTLGAFSEVIFFISSDSLNLETLTLLFPDATISVRLKLNTIRSYPFS